MKPTPSRVQLGLVAAGYAAVVVVAVILVYGRHMVYVHHQDDAMASSGMYAAGDTMLEFFIAGLFLIPTFFLVLAIAKSETAYTRYAQVMLALSLTAPISLGLFSIPAVNQGKMFLGYFCLYRLLASPVVVMVMAMSRLFARFDRPKRLTMYALLIEALTIALIVGLLIFFPTAHRG